MIKVNVVCDECKRFIKLEKPRYREYNIETMGELLYHYDCCDGCLDKK